MSYESIASSTCTQVEFEKSFPPLAERFDNQFLTILPKLKCLDEFGSVVQGDFEASGSTILSIFYSSCDMLARGDCKNEEEVEEWLKHKYVLLVHT